MNKASLSIKAWGIYMIGAGSGFLLIPNIVLPLFGFPTTSEVWIRVLGLLVAIFGSYYFYCGIANLTAFFRVTVPGRILFTSGLGLLVLLGFSGPGLLAFAVLDLLGAAWTWQGLRAQAHGQRTALKQSI